jgi:hypothetical protein
MAMLQGRIATLIPPEHVRPVLKASGKTGVLEMLSRLSAAEASQDEQSMLQSILQQPEEDPLYAMRDHGARHFRVRTTVRSRS